MVIDLKSIDRESVDIVAGAVDCVALVASLRRVARELGHGPRHAL